MRDRKSALGKFDLFTSRHDRMRRLFWTCDKFARGKRKPQERLGSRTITDVLLHCADQLLNYLYYNLEFSSGIDRRKIAQVKEKILTRELTETTQEN